MIYNKYISNNIYEKLSVIMVGLKKTLNLRNIIFMILSFVMVQESVLGEFTPFSLVLFGVASFFNIPLLLILISSIIGILFSTIATTVIIKLFFFFIIFTLITAFINVEGVSEKTSIFIKVLIATVFVELLFGFLQAQLITNFFSILGNILLVSIFYYVYIEGMNALINFNKKYIYSREEKMAMVVVVALALSVFSNFYVFGFSIFNILTFVLVLMYSWKNGPVLGFLTGVIVGLSLACVIPEISTVYLTSIILCGILGGILSKAGKVIVVIVFIIGNLYIYKYSNKVISLPININEILIALISLLFIPRALVFDLKGLFNKNKSLSKPYDNILGEAKDIKNKNGAIREVFNEISKVDIEYTPEQLIETREVIKKYILEYFNNNCLDCQKRRQCIKQKNLDITVDYISTKLENNEKLTVSMIDLGCEFKKEEKIIDEIYEIYISMKLIRILKEKEKEDSLNLNNKYKEVSKILSNINKNRKRENIIISKKQEKLREELKFSGYNIYEDDYKEVENTLEYIFVTDILNDITKQKQEIITIISNSLEQEIIIETILNISKTDRSKIKIILK